MRLTSIFTMAIRSINRNKMRSFLTTLGIVIGVAAVIAMLAIGQGAQKAINDQIASIGTNVIMVMPGAFTQGGVRMEAGTSSRLTDEDAFAISKQCPAVQYVTPNVRTSAQVQSSGQNWRTQIWGVYPDFVAIRDWQFSSGAMFLQSDVRSASKTCVIGQTIVTNLFGSDVDAVGKTIRIKNIPFTIVGVLVSKGQTGNGQDQDDIIIAPFSTVQKKVIGTTYANGLLASAVSADAVEEARIQINQALMDRRKGSQGDGVDFTIRTQTDISTMANQTAKTLGALLASIAFVSLLVGGIGIMNIMLVSVTERTREIGVRMAVGAKGNDVLLQFLVEALVLSFGGGILGVFAGVGTSWLISQTQHWPISISPFSLLLGFGFSAAIGVFFGWYPAKKASRLNPIDALRYE